MKRALKVTLLVFGGFLLAGGLLVWDAFARAARTIRAHEERLAADLAALRATPRLTPIPAVVLSYEQAHAGQEPLLRNYLTLSDLQRRTGFFGPTSADLLQRFAQSQESLREGGYMAYELRRLDEERELNAWKNIAEHKNPKAEELRHVAGMLDQLLAARPTAREVLLGEAVLDRQEILTWLRSNETSYWMLVDGPGWKEMYSRTLLAVKALNEVRDLETLVLGIEALPILERETKAIEEGQKNLRSNRFARSDLAARAGALFQGERLLRTEWSLARAATAILRFQVDKKRNPAELKELAPEYLKELPLNVYTGEPFLWDKEKGILETRPGGQGLQSRWELGRP
jgi:hypothetical protein